MKGTTKTRQRSATNQSDWKGKSPNQSRTRGQWKDNSSENSSGGNVSKLGFAVVSVKLRPAEKEEFQALCKELGFTPNRAMRSMIRQASGFLEVQTTALDELKRITRKISGVAININQIAKAGNRTLSPDFVAFMEDRKALGAELARLEQMMQLILNVGRRRTDGLERLNQVLEAS